MTQNLSSKITETPAISVIVPARNSARHLDKCLEAIRASTFSDYELIVVDDASSDKSAEIARQYTDLVVSIHKASGRLQVRLKGYSLSSGSIIVNVDSDIIVNPDTFGIIYDFFKNNPKVGALTGLLSRSSPVSNFPSRYKHIYMNFTFSKLPDQVSFIYGSIFALNRRTWKLVAEQIFPNVECTNFGDDTELGQFLVQHKISITLLNILEVSHLKRYTLRSLIRNDFNIPRAFAGIFCRFGKRVTISTSKPVYFHTSLLQILAICSIFGSILSFIFSSKLSGFFLFLWLLFNFRFFVFIFQASDWLFLLRAVIFTLVDQFVMGLGVVRGFLDGIILSRIIKTVNK